MDRQLERENVVEEQWIAVNELSKEIDAAENTLKRYIRRHESFLQIKQGSRSKYYVHRDSIGILKQIKALYNDGQKEQEVNERLRFISTPVVITVPTEDDKESISLNVLDAINSINERLEQIEEIGKSSKQGAEGMKELLKISLERQDKLLMELIRTRQELAAEKNRSKKWWKFWE